MSLPLAQTAIAFLIDLAEQGEIDPWDVKVIEVIDRFLQMLRNQPPPEAKHGRSRYEASLSESGQAFLYASMLVLLKADTLIRAELEAAAAEEEVEEPFLEDLAEGAALPRNLERHLHRRAVAAPPRQRRVTLQELIEQLETMAEVMAAQTDRPRSRKARPQAKRQAVRAIAQLAHQENLSEIAAALAAFLDRYWDNLGGNIRWIDFEILLAEWPNFQPPELQSDSHPRTPEETHIHDKVGVFWGLLFLSAQSQVELSQNEFYRDLRVRNLNRVPLDDADTDFPSFILPD